MTHGKQVMFFVRPHTERKKDGLSACTQPPKGGQPVSLRAKIGLCVVLNALTSLVQEDTVERIGNAGQVAE